MLGGRYYPMGVFTPVYPTNTIDAAITAYVILSHFSYLWSAISHLFLIQTFYMGLILTNQTKLDFVDFLWLPLSLHWSAQMRWDKNHGI